MRTALLPSTNPKVESMMTKMMQAAKPPIKKLERPTGIGERAPRATGGQMSVETDPRFAQPEIDYFAK